MWQEIGEWKYMIGERHANFVRFFGDNRAQFINLVCADCTTELNGFPEHKVDMVLADPPYQATRNKWDVPLPMDKLWKELHRVCKKNAVIALHSGGMFTAKLMNSNPKDWRYNLVWHKTTPTGFLNANRMPLRAHEDICIFYRKTPVTYHPQKTYGHERKVSTADHKRNSKMSTDYGEYGLISYDSTERYPTSVLTFSTDKQRGAYHSTQKPVKLEEWLIKTYTDPRRRCAGFLHGFR